VVSYAVWKRLNESIETRREDQECNFYVRWGVQKFNVIEMNTIKEFGNELLLLKKDVEKEIQFFKRGVNHPLPAGIMLLDDTDDDVMAVKEQVLYKKLYLNPNIPLSTTDRTMDHFDNLDNEQVYNFTESDRQLFEDDLHCVMVILDNQTDGKDKFIVITPEITDKQKCEEYAANKDVKSAGIVHIVVNINLSKGKINLTEKNGHWAYTAIHNEKEIVYGDPLGGQRVPTNLLEVLNPIYRAMYGKDIVRKSMEIKNCSNNPNFPTQSCSTICGLISAMICICSFNSQLYREIMFGNKQNGQLQFIKTPSEFAQQIRMRFVKIVNSKKHCVQGRVQKNKEMSK
jgi:hypothetical protein